MEGIFVEDETWDQIVKASEGLGVDEDTGDFKPVWCGRCEKWLYKYLSYSQSV